ncbi:MAG TPA: hypothetical protein VFX25_23960 [Streptosporangiaceae bacterium]|nr:hypothetical protein [Streptosporangiaceae bacterium]
MVAHEPGRCAGCGAALFAAPVTGAQRRQVIDLPEDIRALVTEHQMTSRRCACGTTGSAPADAAAPAGADLHRAGQHAAVRL